MEPQMQKTVMRSTPAPSGSPGFARYWRERLDEAFNDARGRTEIVIFVLALLAYPVGIISPTLDYTSVLYWMAVGVFAVVLLVQLCFVAPYRHAQKQLEAHAAAMATKEHEIELLRQQAVSESHLRAQKIVDQACAILRATPNQTSFTLRALQLAGVAELETEEEFTFICQALVNRNYPDPRDLIESVLPDGWLNFIRFANKDGRALDRPESVYENGMRMYGTFAPPSCSDAEFGALLEIALSPLNPTPPLPDRDKEEPPPSPVS